MTSREFVIWFKGFMQAANSYNITPKQWEDVKEMLNKVDDDSIRGTRYVLDNINWNVSMSSESNTYDSSKVF